MEKRDQISAVCDIRLLDSYWCKNYLSEGERASIMRDYEAKTAVVLGFYGKESDPLFVAVYNLEKNSLHVTHVVGNFGRYIKMFDEFSRVFARMCGYAAVTFCSKRRAITDKWAERAGYAPTEIKFEFKKRVA